MRLSQTPAPLSTRATPRQFSRVARGRQGTRRLPTARPTRGVACNHPATMCILGPVEVPVLPMLLAIMIALPAPGGAQAQALPDEAPLAHVLGRHSSTDNGPTGFHGAGALSRTFHPTTLEPSDLRLPDASTLQALVDSTSEARIRETMARLERFGTRYVVTDSCLASARWIVERFEAMDVYDVRVDTFRTWTWQDSVDAWNVIAVRRGSTRPDEHVILGGHYDSVSFESLSDPWAPAPGADDNASGVAAVLEAARTLARYETERTLVFACWSAEEEGLWGSRDYVARAVDESLDIVLYLNLDAIGYNAVGDPDGIVYADSVSYAVAALAADIAADQLDLDYTAVEQPIGASDQNSFAERGYRVLDTSSNPLYSPYHHSANDLLEHVDTGIVREITAINTAVLASVAFLAGHNENLPPETRLHATCAAVRETVCTSPTFSWTGVDFDGTVSGYALDVLSIGHPNGRTSAREEILGPDVSEVTLSLEPGSYVFTLAAIDDDGGRDPSAARHLFTATDAVAPEVVISTDFLRDTLAFTGLPGRLTDPVPVFVGERLSLSVAVDASAYCGSADRAAVSLMPGTPNSFTETPFETTLRPTAADTAIYVVAHEPGCDRSAAWIPLDPAPATFDRGILHVDDWIGGGVDESAHDGFYARIVDDAEEWDPYEHIVEGSPTLPSREIIGRYGTVIWTLARGGGLMRQAHAGDGWRLAEGYVRAGGNLVVEGQSAAATLSGLEPLDLLSTTPQGSFLRTRAGVESVATTGSAVAPPAYGYAFLGGLPAATGLPPLPVDTLGTWADGYQSFGGLPWCEIYRPGPETDRLYLFDAYRNDAFDERPCALLTRSTDGAGSVVIMGFPLYYIREANAREALGMVIDALESWQEPSELSYFSHEATTDSVVLAWYLDPVEGPAFCRLERTLAGHDYHTVADSVTPDETGRYRVVDAPPPGSSPRYRLIVTERSGVVVTHGPWEVPVPLPAPDDGLSMSSALPSRGAVDFDYSVGDDHRWIRLTIHDVAGRLVSVVEEGHRDAGRYEAQWDGRSDGGTRAASGVYFARLAVGRSSVTCKLVLLR
ncbi:MAG: M20/M25/M40 family metallo-hydrolase [Candidatus Eisenbacteria bacterium]|nr:M20/M25/M40 family metallo-hydrolase [Candidatus Eisenbacteria bacterium]